MKIIDIPQSGKLGTFVSFRTRHGQSRRRYVVPKDPRTPAQLGVRSRLGRFSAQWRTLTDAQRLAWITAADSVTCHGRLGQSGRLTGCQLFVSINGNLDAIGLDRVDLPPTCPAFSVNPVGNLTITNTGGVIAFKLSVPSAPVQHTLVWGTAPGSAGAYFPGRFVFLGLLPVIPLPASATSPPSTSPGTAFPRLECVSSSKPGSKSTAGKTPQNKPPPSSLRAEAQSCRGTHLLQSIVVLVS